MAYLGLQPIKAHINKIIHIFYTRVFTVLDCPVFDPPRHGAYACNVRVNDQYNQHLYCSVQCQKGYAYVSDQVYDYYLCAEGIWTGFTQPQRRPPHRFMDTSVRPWVDCTGKNVSLYGSKDVNILLFHLY